MDNKNIMPSIELIEHDTVVYVKGMEEYLQQLKSMTKSEAQKTSFKNLIKSGIITEDGELIEKSKEDNT